MKKIGVNKLIETFDTTYNIIDKVISIPVNITETLVKGDSNSKIIHFRILRFYDGVDLSNKDVYVCYKNASGQTGETVCINRKTTNVTLTFDWIIPSEVTTSAGIIFYFVEFRTVDNANQKIYCWKTIEQKYQVANTFEVTNTALPSPYTAEKVFLNINPNRVSRSDISGSGIPIKIVGKTIQMKQEKPIAVMNDNMSVALTFRIPRYYDNVDRQNMTFCFPYVNANRDSDISCASNVMITEDEVFISWILDSKVTHFSGKVRFMIGVLGYLQDNSFYSWYTQPAEIEVKSTINITTLLDEPQFSWYESWAVEADNILQQTAQIRNKAEEYYDLAEKGLKSTKEVLDSVKVYSDFAKDYCDRAETAFLDFYNMSITRDNYVNDIFETVNYYRSNGKLYLKSQLIKTNNIYDGRTETIYASDGTTILSVKNYHINRDPYGNITGTFGNLNQLQYHKII